MPRAPCIDRTITITEAVVIILDIENQKNYTQTVYLAKGFTSEIGFLRRLRRTWQDKSKTLPVHVLTMKTYRRNFHLTEDELINLIIRKEQNNE